MARTHEEINDLLNHFAITVAGLECLRDFLLEELGRQVAPEEVPALEDKIRAEAGWKWNEEAYRRSAEVSLRFGLGIDDQISERVLKGEPLLSPWGNQDRIE